MTWLANGNKAKSAMQMFFFIFFMGLFWEAKVGERYYLHVSYVLHLRYKTEYPYLRTIETLLFLRYPFVISPLSLRYSVVIK